MLEPSTSLSNVTISRHKCHFEDYQLQFFKWKKCHKKVTKEGDAIVYPRSFLSIHGSGNHSQTPKIIISGTGLLSEEDQEILIYI